MTGDEPAGRNRHRKLARAVVLANESADRFCELAEEFYAEHKPGNPVERNLVDVMIVARWRQLRAEGSPRVLS